MNTMNYIDAALKTIKPHVSKDAAYCDWALGISGEAAEVSELVARSIATVGAPVMTMELAKELGDCLWYLVALVAETDVDASWIDFDTHYDADDIFNGKYSDEEKLLRAADLNVSAGKIAEQIKHVTMHHEKLNKHDLGLACSNFLWSIVSVGDEFGVD